MGSDQVRSGDCYLLNTAILTDFGEWRFEGPLSVARAQEELATGFTSAIGHEAAARFMTQLLGVPVAANRISVSLSPGDRAVVLRLKERLPEGKTLTLEEMQQLSFELGLLTRLS